MIYGRVSNLNTAMTNATTRIRNYFIPDDIKVHHGNWANGIESKIEVLDFVYNKVRGTDG